MPVQGIQRATVVVGGKVLLEATGYLLVIERK